MRLRARLSRCINYLIRGRKAGRPVGGGGFGVCGGARGYQKTARPRFEMLMALKGMRCPAVGAQKSGRAGRRDNSARLPRVMPQNLLDYLNWLIISSLGFKCLRIMYVLLELFYKLCSFLLWFLCLWCMNNIF